MTAPNAALAYAVLDQIDAHPELHRQKFWFTVLDCGTAGCFAGWGCILSGDRPCVEDSVESEIDGFTIFKTVETLEGVEYVEWRAENLFGITEADAYRLFHSSNSVGDLHVLVPQIFGPRPDSCGYPLTHPAHMFQLPDEDLVGEFGPKRQCPGMSGPAPIVPPYGTAVPADWQRGGEGGSADGEPS